MNEQQRKGIKAMKGTGITIAMVMAMASPATAQIGKDWTKQEKAEYAMFRHVLKKEMAADPAVDARAENTARWRYMHPKANYHAVQYVEHMVNAAHMRAWHVARIRVGRRTVKGGK